MYNYTFAFTDKHLKPNYFCVQSFKTERGSIKVNNVKDEVQVFLEYTEDIDNRRGFRLFNSSGTHGLSTVYMHLNDLTKLEYPL